MKRQIFVCLCAVGAAASINANATLSSGVFACSSAAASQDFADGAVHQITSEIDDKVTVSNGTTVRLSDPGIVFADSGLPDEPAINLLDTSKFSVLSGQVRRYVSISNQTGDRTAAQLGGNSHLNVSGGLVRADSGDATATGASLGGHASVEVSGGSIEGQSFGFPTPGVGVGMNLIGSAAATIAGGRLLGLQMTSGKAFGMILSENSQVSISGGIVQAVVLRGGDATGLLLEDNATATISGGDLIFTVPPASHNYGVVLNGNSSLLLTGGKISSISGVGTSEYISANDHSRVEIRGGRISGDPKVIANGSSEIVVYGKRFNYSVNSPITDEVGVLRGRYLSGEPFAISFARESTAVIRPVLVPEGRTIELMTWLCPAFIATSRLKAPLTSTARRRTRPRRRIRPFILQR
jgi:hypothetical protein